VLPPEGTCGGWDENIERKDFLPTEAVAIGPAIADYEKAEARKRMAEGGRSGMLGRRLPGC
jgi:hypothetical protein